MLFLEPTSEKRPEELFLRIMPQASVCRIERYCERWGDAKDEVRRYDVYRILCKEGRYVLKRDRDTGEEARILCQYLTDADFSVPRFCGEVCDAGECWLVTEEASGRDLRDMTDAACVAAAKAIASIHNRYWDSPRAARFDRYRNRIERRAAFFEAQSAIGRAYALFVRRQEELPCTLCHGDLLPWNMLWDGRTVTLLDWENGGILPYTLDAARFFAHATEDRRLFPFYMTDAQKRLFVQTYTASLRRPIERTVFERDLDLAVLNEYCEFIEADEDETGAYRALAESLAEHILAEWFGE